MNANKNVFNFLKFALTCRDSTNVVDAWMRICPWMDGIRATQEQLPRNDHSRLFAEEMILIYLA